MNWFDCLDTFIKVAENQSFIGAARSLGTTNSVITKRIQWLEGELSRTLLIRTTRKVTLTDAGEHLLTQIKPLLNEWHEVHSQLLDFTKQPQGEISVCMPPLAVCAPLFMSTFTEFLHAYPSLRLHLTPSHEPISLVDKNIDVLIVNEKYVLEPSTTVGVKLAEFMYQCYASPSYIKEHGELKSLDDLKNHNCLLYRKENQWEFAGKKYTVSGNMRSDSGGALLNACLLGAGILYIPPFLVKQAVDDGLIKPLLKKEQCKKSILRIFYTKREYVPCKIRAFIKFLKNKITIYL